MQKYEKNSKKTNISKSFSERKNVSRNGKNE